MAAVPRAYIDNFTAALNRVSVEAQHGVLTALASIDWTQDVAAIREQVIAIMQVWCGGATDMAGVLAAEFYDGLRAMELGAGYGAVASTGRIPAATDGAVRAFAEELVNGRQQAFVDLCVERVDYETKIAANENIVINAQRDSRKPRYARVPDGSETCDFCLMLASRGFVYRNDVAASHAHSGCDCRVVPSWRAYEVEGYDPVAIYGRWQEAIEAKAEERAERKGTSFEEERAAIMAKYASSAKVSRQRRRL